MKKLVMRGLSLTPGLLLAIKRFGVRIGLAQSMGPGHITINGRRRGSWQSDMLSARGARIHEQLCKAIVKRGG
ncbi:MULTISPECIES: hypothetical protein [Xanthomonas]|uniref:hypothetical protein n=1 Tax=Xanthomonas TaxID=338 RepID=UPI001FD5A96A|nr:MULTISPECIES: hypothetical protein [Xanthomonas]